MSFTEQYLFKLGNKTNYLEEDYILGDANKESYDYLKYYPFWSDVGYGRVVYLTGAASSGKTHLASIWQSDTGAMKILERDFYSDNFIEKIKSRKFLLLEDIERLSNFEEKLFFLINTVLENKMYLLITSRKSANNLDFKLKDLISRLNAFNNISIKDPDIEILKSVFLKLISDRQLRISLEILNFIIQRLERTFFAVEQMVINLDQLSLGAKRNITIPFINEYCDKLNLKHQ